MFIKLKDNKIVSGFPQTQQYIIILYLDGDMFQSLVHHQAIFTKVRIRYMQCTACTLFKKARIKLLFITHHTKQ